jgi:FtsZ-binding cell division protein ZapB
MSRVEAALTRAQQEPDEVKKIALLTAKLKELTEANAALTQQVVAVTGERDQWHRIADIERERGDFYADAAKNRKDAGTVSDAIVAEYKAQLDRADVEIERQRKEIEKLRNPSFFSELFKPSELFKIGGAFAFGRLTCQ